MMTGGNSSAPCETKYDRALRRARKLRLRLSGDPTDDEYPNKPPRMRWATYNRLLGKLRAADGVERRLLALAFEKATTRHSVHTARSPHSKNDAFKV
jgi:hypothetical protein